MIDKKMIDGVIRNSGMIDVMVNELENFAIM